MRAADTFIPPRKGRIATVISLTAAVFILLSGTASAQYCAAGTMMCDEYIANVTVAGINNSSGCGLVNGYSDYTAGTPGVMHADHTYPVTIYNPVPYTGDAANVWIDWNNNLSFADAGEYFTTTTTNNSNFSGSILCPVGTVTGAKCMRVRMSYGVVPGNTCGIETYGEVEDYTIYVTVISHPLITLTTYPSKGTPANQKVVATITDDGSLAAAAIWYRRNNGAWVNAAPESVTGSSYTFTIDHTAVGGAAHGDVIDWYLGARDDLDHVATDPPGGSGATPPGSTPPTLLYSYQIMDPICGIFSIGGVSPDYPSFTTAVEALIQHGICGPVTFNVAAGTYTEAITIPEIFGATSTNTITFDGGEGNAASRILQHDTPNMYNCVVTLDGADYIRLSNLTIRSTGTTYGCGVLFTNSADHNEISMCNVEVFANSSNWTIYGIQANSKTTYLTGNAAYGDHGSYNLIKDNTITGGNHGILWYGFSASDYTAVRGNQFIGNTITGWYRNGILLEYAGGGVVVRGNTSVQRTTGTFYTAGGWAYAITSPNDGPEISYNYGFAAGLFYISLPNYSYASVNNRAKVYNNMGATNHTCLNYGLYVLNPRYTDCVYNSVYMKTDNTAYGLYCTAGGTTYQNRFANNWIVLEGNGTFYAQIGLGSGSANNFTTFDNNAYYRIGTGSTAYYWNGSAYPTLEAMQATSPGFNQHSVYGEPLFVSGTDLHSASIVGYRAGMDIPGITDDFDGETRHSPPCIGADEYVFCTITCPDNINTANDPGVCGAVVTFAPTVSEGCGAVTCTPPSGSVFPVGTTTVTCLTAEGPQCGFDVTVYDNEGPVITANAPITLWPIDHGYSTITVAQMVASIVDNCGLLAAADVSIIGATSDEAETGEGTGNTLNDIVIANDCKSVDLRRERAGTGNGRVYKITLSATDLSLNNTTAVYTVCVPHNVGLACTEDPAMYTVTGPCGTPKAGNVAALPGNLTLEQNYPNPFNPVTNIVFTTSEAVHSTLRVFDVYGQLVATLVDGPVASGTHRFDFDASALPSGTYVYRLEAAGKVLQRNMTLIK